MSHDLEHTKKLRDTSIYVKNTGRSNYKDTSDISVLKQIAWINLCYFPPRYINKIDL